MAPALHTSYRKWLRYYLGFCSKYRFETASSKSPIQFLTKLREKNQAEWQVKQAAHAVSLYLEKEKARAEPADGERQAGHQEIQERKLSAEPAGLREAIGQSFGKWGKAHADLVAVIKTKHYSPKTLKSYVKTTMIYTHTVPSRTVKEARSPLDFPSAEIDPKL